MVDEYARKCTALHFGLLRGRIDPVVPRSSFRREPAALVKRLVTAGDRPRPAGFAAAVSAEGDPEYSLEVKNPR